MISAVARTSLRTRAAARMLRSEHHDIPAPNGMHLPFDTQKKGFKFLYWGSCAFFGSLPVIAAWWQLRKGNGNKDY
ncbi:hypothetical protein H4R18_001486 [Coemansia javaensis]|uniref:Cytochrome c oxidase subunit 8, mitochondrial n=1 Tax=Coemansia javaensis TaxID=2761396 RepID=A0A9W8HFG9_9FUNG|nr:hypothetical protein H4R18_001486 [Coemansia javaensis]